jgi:hypothetical protein
MMYYYRGLLYLWKSDFGNARACFANGILQDAFAEEAQNRCDFGVLYFLSVYAAKMGVNEAIDDEKELLRLRPDAPKIDINSVLVICETGKGPRKLADGVGHYELKLRRGKSFKAVCAQIVTADGTMIRAYPIEDIAFQAMTRGGRPIDAILAGKVRFQNNAADIGTTLTTVSTTAILSSTIVTQDAKALQGVGVGTAALGAIFDIAAIKSRPHADVRAWDNLPDTIHVAFLGRSAVRAGFTVQFLGADGSVVGTTQLGGPSEQGTNPIWCRDSE